MAMVPLGMVVVIQDTGYSGSGGHEREAVAKTVRVCGRPRHLPEYELDKVPVRIHVLRSAQQESTHLWCRIPYAFTQGDNFP